jgi:hypothetical protein
MLSEFTSPDEVRAVLGVSDDEIEDETLLLPLYELMLTEDLETVGSGLTSTFRTVSDLSIDDRTNLQKRLYNLTRLFSAYAVAKHLLTSLPYFGEQRMADGRAEKERIADPYEKTMAGVLSGLNDLRLRLSAVFAAETGTPALSTTARIYATSTGLAIDPVTNS